jgi:hypothetical protein
MCLEIKQFTIKMNERYRDYKKLFLARDGFILYEAQITMFNDNSDIIYVSRDTLQEYFNMLKEQLDLVIKRRGISNIENIIHDLVVVYRNLYDSDHTYHALFDSLIRYLRNYFANKLLFVDSSSMTLPVVLAAISKMFNPEMDVKVYFFSTIYTDHNAGYLIGQTKNFSVDMMPDYVEYDKDRSSVIPYVPKLLPIFIKTGKMKQPQAYMTHLVLQSILRS